MKHRIGAKFAGAAAVVAAVVVAAAAAHATSVLKLDLEDLTANSDRIVVADVESIESERMEGRIVTHIEVRVREQWKGPSEAPDLLTIRKPGGRIGDTVTRVHGMPKFRRGERTVLFLEALPDGSSYAVTGLRQGKFHVATGPDGETKYVVPRLGNAKLLEPASEEADDETSDSTPGSRLERIDASKLRVADPAPIHETVTPLDEMRERVRTSTETRGNDR